MSPGGILISFGFSALTGLLIDEPLSVEPSPLSGFGGGDPPLFPGAAATLPPLPSLPFKHDL